MNIFMVEMKAHKKSLIIWAFAILFMVAGGMGKYAGLSTGGQSMTELLSQMPESMKAIMGIGNFDFSKASGFYGMIFFYLVLMATIHAVMLGSDIISKEERDKTVEFLLAKPISRNKIITLKLLAGLANIIIFNIITLISSLIVVGKLAKGESVSTDIVILMVGMFILQIIFMLIGTAIAAVVKNPKKSTAIGTAVLLISFIMSVAIDINSKLDCLKYTTLFKYYEAKNLMSEVGFQLSYVILSIIIIAVMLKVTYGFYNERDMSI